MKLSLEPLHSALAKTEGLGDAFITHHFLKPLKIGHVVQNTLECCKDFKAARHERVDGNRELQQCQGQLWMREGPVEAGSPDLRHAKG